MLLKTRFFTAQKMKLSVKDFFSKDDQICRKLQIWSHLLKKSLMENFIFRAVLIWSAYSCAQTKSGISLFKINIGKARAMFAICSKLTIKTTE